MKLSLWQFATIATWFSVGITIFVAGCDSSTLQRFDVYGQITYDGQPVPRGEIVFTPRESVGAPGIQGRAIIKDGKFTTEQSNQGCPQGKYRAEIRGADGVPFQGAEFWVEEGKQLFPSVGLDVEVAGDELEIAIAVESTSEGATAQVVPP